MTKYSGTENHNANNGGPSLVTAQKRKSQTLRTYLLCVDSNMSSSEEEMLSDFEREIEDGNKIGAGIENSLFSLDPARAFAEIAPIEDKTFWFSTFAPPETEEAANFERIEKESTSVLNLEISRIRSTYNSLPLDFEYTAAIPTFTEFDQMVTLCKTSPDRPIPFVQLISPLHQLNSVKDECLRLMCDELIDGVAFSGCERFKLNLLAQPSLQALWTDLLVQLSESLTPLEWRAALDRMPPIGTNESRLNSFVRQFCAVASEDYHQPEVDQLHVPPAKRARVDNSAVDMMYSDQYLCRRLPQIIAAHVEVGSRRKLLAKLINQFIPGTLSGAEAFSGVFKAKSLPGLEMALVIEIFPVPQPHLLGDRLGELVAAGAQSRTDSINHHLSNYCQRQSHAASLCRQWLDTWSSTERPFLLLVGDNDLNRCLTRKVERIPLHVQCSVKSPPNLKPFDVLIPDPLLRHNRPLINLSMLRLLAHVRSLPPLRQPADSVCSTAPHRC